MDSKLKCMFTLHGGFSFPSAGGSNTSHAILLVHSQLDGRWVQICSIPIQNWKASVRCGTTQDPSTWFWGWRLMIRHWDYFQTAFIASLTMTHPQIPQYLLLNDTVSIVFLTSYLPCLPSSSVLLTQLQPSIPPTLQTESLLTAKNQQQHKHPSHITTACIYPGFQGPHQLLCLKHSAAVKHLNTQGAPQP